eukprot:TRINITY_DN1219_c0_g1_i2.p1 TRINITY_DN1219_c0_g1~~TRINITY_DN1219_c0_g1_i2.p1  ORF type:complete len:436 (+),score=80.85 TRINITY_DN1219_c0_g1_i2:269-1576(+)
MHHSKYKIVTNRGASSRRCQSAEVFFHEAARHKLQPQPCFCVDGVNYFHVKTGSLFCVLCCAANASPSFALELLGSIIRVFKDYCGVLCEESVRQNLYLLYELLDEMIDFGYVQATSTEYLQGFILNSATVPPTSNVAKLEVMERVAPKVLDRIYNSPLSAYVMSVNRPVSRSGSKEIFVDLVERLSVTFAPTGEVVSARSDGSLVVRNYLIGAPAVGITLSEDAQASDYGSTRASGGITGVLDDFNFHESVHADSFAQDGAIALAPPPGEMIAMNYRTSRLYQLPFHIAAFVDEHSPTKVDIAIQLRTELPHDRHAQNVTVEFPVPKATESVFFEAATGTTEFNQSSCTVTWRAGQLLGGSEHTLRTKVTLSQPCTSSVKKEVGPVNMQFDVPMWNCSHVQIRSVTVEARDAGQAPYRWVRHFTTSTSYLRRLT